MKKYLLDIAVVDFITIVLWWFLIVNCSDAPMIVKIAFLLGVLIPETFFIVYVKKYLYNYGNIEAEKRSEKG